MQRPQMNHMTTSPNLTVPSSNWEGHNKEAQGSEARLDQILANQPEGTNLGTSAQNLFSLLKNRCNTEYKNIRFTPKQKGNPDFEPRISFDTIDLHINDPGDPNFLEDEHTLYRKMLHLEPDYRLDSRGRGRDKDFLTVSPQGPSPGTSPSRMKSPSRREMAAFFGPQIKYPTVPIVTRRCSLIAKMHKDFEKLYLGQLAKQDLSPLLPGRVILVYISARKHTWVAVDWVMHNFIENGDTIVIVASLPQPLGKNNQKRNNYRNDPYFAPKTERMRQRQRNQPEFIKQIAMNIMDYALCVVKPNVISKVVVEIAEGKTKDVLKDMYKLYEPNIVCTGSRTNQNSSTPLRSWDSSRLSDRLVKNFPLPVIVVPALNLGQFESSLSAEISGESPSLAEGAQNSGEQRDLSEELKEALGDSDVASISDESLSSDASANSESSAESYTSFDEIAHLYTDYKSKVGHLIVDLKKQERNEDYYANFIKAISDESLKFCEELRGVDPDFKRKGALLAREITGSNLFGAVPYKTKSLLPPIEKPATHSGSATPGISYSEMKKNLKLNAEKAREKANASPDGEEEAPKTPQSRALKFADSEKPKRGKKSKPLKKFLSNEDSSSRRVNIAPSHSHPDIRITPASDDSEKKQQKKKKRNFWKIF